MQGEPLNNYAAVKAAVSMLTDGRLFSLQRQKVTVSTVGVIPKVLQVSHIFIQLSHCSSSAAIKALEGVVIIYCTTQCGHKDASQESLLAPFCVAQIGIASCQQFVLRSIISTLHTAPGYSGLPLHFHAASRGFAWGQFGSLSACTHPRVAADDSAQR